MIHHLRKHLFHSLQKGHTIYHYIAKGLFALWVMIFVFGDQKVLAVDFKTYLKGAQEEVLRHKEIIDEDPLDAVAYFELGKAFLALGRHKDEVEAYQEAIKINPKYTAAHYNLSMAYDLLKDGSNAIKHMLRARDLYSEKRNHASIRKVQRQLKFLHLKYQAKTIAPKSLN
jgi:tetratricopeptide (TPR) repeat protein